MDDYSSDVTTTGAVMVGGSVTGVIEIDGDVDWFAVQLEAGQGYRFDIEGLDSRKGTLPDPLFTELYGSDGYSLGYYDDDSGFGRDALINISVNTSGTYYAAVTSPYYSSGVGSYTLSVTEITDDYTADTATTGRLDVGGSTTGSIQFSRDKDWFAIQLEAGQTYAFELTSDNGSPGITGIMNAAGAEVFSTFRAGDVRFTATDTGTYYIQTQSYDYDTTRADYTLSAEAFLDDYANDASTTGELTVGGSVAGIHEAAQYYRDFDSDWFAVTLEAGTIYRFAADFGQEYYYSRPLDVNLFDATSTEVPNTAQGHNDYTHADMPVFDIVADGTYYVEVKREARSATDRDYTLSAEALYVREDDERALQTEPANIYNWDEYLTASTGGTGADLLISGADASEERRLVLRGLEGRDTIIGSEADEVLMGDDALASDLNFDALGAIYSGFQMMLGRAPDAVGQAAFLTEMKGLSSGYTYQVSYDLTQPIMNSAEFKALHGTLDNAGFVDVLYAGLRGPDGAGGDPARELWIERLDIGYWSAAEVAASFVMSAEAQNMAGFKPIQQILNIHADPRDTTQTVYDSYSGLLGRDPDATGFAHWEAAVAGGMDAASLAAIFIDSPEFAARAMDTRAFVTSLITTFSDTPPTTGEIDRAEALIQNGTDPADFAASLIILADADGTTDWVRAQGPDDVLIGGGGDNILFGGAMSDRFVFDPATGGSHRIADFEAWDQLNLRAFGYADIATARAAFAQDGDDLVLMDQGVSLRITDTDLALLTDDVFLI